MSAGGPRLAVSLAVGIIVWLLVAVAAHAHAAGTAEPERVTAYCLRGTTANGQHGYYGSAAKNGVPFGSRWRISGTYYTFTVNDRIGHGSDLDLWTSDCRWADRFGRRTLRIERVR